MKQNNYIKCSCGCNNSLLQYDDRGRVRKSLWGHNKSTLGIKFSKEHRNKLSLSHKGQGIGNKNPNWVGDNAAYTTLHNWVRRWLGRPKVCSKCGTTTAKKFEWANISRQYKRNLSDWIRLCVSCHRYFDGHSQKAWQTRRAQFVS